MACNEYESDEVPRRVREDKEKRTKDGAQGQHKRTSRGSKKKPAKEMEKDSQGSRRKIKTTFLILQYSTLKNTVIQYNSWHTGAGME